ncbi:hypothetical protein PLEOSDRAFT_1078328 [Pleurotus ostreatus PC15]|uniref:SP-RING-type domain-containing protein n=1 Tax=Pleurotus ostreatus (strain PC15) TaxID=1137138 RepID=A0A067ND94_PLEO1|nr:hypothetical protein PLEOSDRAFT_1078328 [Pleurotus ostreatus PC15]
MARAARRTRPARTQAESDIEDEPETQPSQDERQPSAKGKNARRGDGRSNASRMQVDGEDEPKTEAAKDEDDDDDENDRIDVANFYNQPLTKEDLPRLKGLAGDWGTMHDNIANKTGFIAELAASIADLDVFSREDSEKGVEALEMIMRDIVDVGAEMKANEQVLDSIYQDLARGEAINEAVNRYTAGIHSSLMEYEQKTTRQKYVKNPQYIQFKQSIWVRRFIPPNDGDDSDDDDDEIEVGGVTQDFKCPLSLMPLQDPWTSSVCGHSFSGDAIRDYFRGNHGAKKCPAAGCNRSFTLAQCKADADLAKKVKGVLRRQQRRADDSDADEVVD